MNPFVLPALAVVAIASAIPAWIVPQQSLASFAAQPAAVDAEAYFGHAILADISDLHAALRGCQLSYWNGDQRQSITVMQDVNGVWRISSRDGYPADATDRLGRVAAALTDVRKLRHITDSVDHHQRLGVLDPRAADALDGTGRGVHVQLQGPDGVVLQDLIIGAAVDHMPGQYYVREADSNTVYTAACDRSVLSARFIDWVQPNPLTLDGADVTDLMINNYSVDEQSGRVDIRSALALERSTADGEWTASHELADDTELDQAQVSQLLRRLTSLRLADVLRHDGLSDQQLQVAGVFTTPDGQIVANEGVLRVGSSDGFGYNVLFGEVAASATSEQRGAVVLEQDRLVLVAVDYDPRRDQALAELQAQATELAEEDAESLQQSLQAHQLQRQQHLAFLQRKYASYFYVISDDDFQQLRPDASALLVRSHAGDVPAAE